MAFVDDCNRWLQVYQNDVVKPPRIVPLRHGLDGYELFIDSPLGYESQGVFGHPQEALYEAEENWDVFWR